MSFSIEQEKAALKISATIRTTDEWNKFCNALAKYRDKFEPKAKEERK